MKKILLSLALAFGMQAGAQTIDTIVTIDTLLTPSLDTLLIRHLNDGTTDSMTISKIDSMTFDTATVYTTIYDTTVTYDTIWSQGGLGNIILPGNATCDTQYISVTGCGGLTTLTYNGYTYDLVEIGGQCWFNENLQTTTYRDGTPIDYPGTDNTTWGNNTTGAYAWYDDDSTTYDSVYGKLYNWFAVDNSAGLCPTGWHVPTDCEWMYLEGTLGMSTVKQENSLWRGTDEGGKLKEAGTTYWNSPNAGATNSSGFSGLPGGHRNGPGNCGNVGIDGFWWSSSQFNSSNAWYRSLNYDFSNVNRNYVIKENGFSVRCIKD